MKKTTLFYYVMFLCLISTQAFSQFNEVENNNNISNVLASSQSRIHMSANYQGTVTSSDSDFWILSRKENQLTDVLVYFDRTWVNSNPDFNFRVWEYRGGNWGVTPVNIGTLRTLMQPSGIYSYTVNLPYSSNVSGGNSNNYYAIEIFTGVSSFNYNFNIGASTVNSYYYCYDLNTAAPTAIQTNDTDVTLNNLGVNSFDDLYYIVKFSSTNSFTDFTDAYIQNQALPIEAVSNSYNGSGEHVVYVGTDNGALQSALTMTNLQRNATYYYKIYTYSDCNGYINYNNTIASVSVTTCPGTAPNIGSVNSVTATSPTTATINTLGRPTGADADTGYIVKFSDTNSFTAPSGATLPTASLDYTGKTGEQVVYTGVVGSGAGTTDDINQIVSGLQINTNYYVKVYTYDLCGGTINFDTTGSSVVTTNYVCATPSSAVTSIVANTTGATTMNIASFTPPSNTSQGTLSYIVKVSDVDSFTTPTSVPSSPNAVYNTATGGEQVMYVGSSATPNISVSGLVSNGTYYIKVYAYNTCAGSEYFETTGSTTVSVTTCGAPTGNSELNSFRTDLHWEYRLSPIISNVPATAEGQVVKINTVNTFTDIMGGINTLPTANTNYSGSGEQVVLAGVFPEGQAFTTYDLLPNTQYFFKIYSYTECAGTYYFSNTSDVISTHTPGVTDKLSSNAVINNFTGTAFTLASFTAAAAADNGLGIPKGYIVKMNTVNSFTPHSFRGPTPTPDADYKGGEQVVYFGASTNPNQEITGLTPNTTYYFTIYAYNDSGAPYFFNSYQQTGYEFSVVNNGSLLTPTITFDDVAVNAGGANFNLNATSDSSGAISYKIISDGGTGTTLSGTNNETVTVGSAGTVIIEASQAATATHQIASKTMTLTINAPQATLGGGIVYEVNSGPTTLDMTTGLSSNSTGAYTFEIIGQTLGYTINGNLLNLNNVAGSILIKVTQAADANYSETVAYYSTIFYNAGFSPKTDIAHNLFDFSLNPGESYTIITAQNFSGQATTYSIVDNGGTGSTLVGNVFTAGGAGTVTLRAFTPDNFLYNATTTDVTVTVIGTPQTITFNTLSNVTYGDAAFNLTGTASSGLAVTYTSSDPTIASISGSTVTIHKDGTVNITASQAGSGVYDPASNVVQPLTVNPITLVNQNVALNTTGSGLCSTTATVSLDNSRASVNYYLRNNSDNSIIEGPVAGTGGGISFASEVLMANRTYNVIAVQGNQTLPSATNTLQMTSTPIVSVQTLDGKTVNLTQPDGGSAVVSVASSQLGISYYLQDNTTNEVLQGPLTGTGVDLSFTSETITADRTYKVVGTDAMANHGERGTLRLDNVDDYVSVPAINSHLSNVQQATIETWVKIPASDATDVNASIITAESYAGFGIASVVVPFYINISGGTIFAGHYDDDVDDGGAYNTPGYTYPVDTWFHVAATMNGASINFYVNGNLIGSTGAYSGFEIFQLTSNIRLGRNYESTSNSTKLFGGDLAQTRIWNGIRTESDITSNMNTQFTTLQANLVLNYNYDQTSGASVTDTSGNSITGTLQNGAGDATNWVKDLFTDSVCGFVPMNNTVTAAFTALQDQVITFNAIASKTYGDATFDLAATTDSGLPVSYVSSNTSVATISGSTVTIVGAGNTNITASQAGDATYNPATDVVQNFNVLKKMLTISPQDATVSYGVLDLPIDNSTENYPFKVTGLVNGDIATDVVKLFTGGADISDLTIVNASNPGQALDVGIHNGVLAWATAPILQLLSTNYEYNALGTGNLTINAASVTVTAEAKSKDYNGNIATDPTLTYAVDRNNLPTGTDVITYPDPFSFTGALSRVAGQDAGTYAINQGTLSLGSNYVITFNSADFTINKVNLTATSVSEKIYGDALSTLPIQYTGFVNGENASVIDTPPTAIPAVTIDGTTPAGGSHVVNVSGGSDNNYTIVTNNGTLTVTKRILSATVDNKTKVYGESNPTFTMQYSNFVNGDNESNITQNITLGAYEVGSTLVSTTTGVGEYVITNLPGQFIADNYLLQITNLGVAKLTITRKAIEVTADAKSKVYGDSDPAFTYQITNGSLVGSDVFTGSLSRITGEGVGVYIINKGSLDTGANYDLSFVANNLTIGKKAIEVTADAKSKIYGDSNPVLTYRITNGSLVGSDAFTGSLSRETGETVFNSLPSNPFYAITQGTLVLNANYDLTFVDSKFRVTPKNVNFSLENASKVYGEVDPLPVLNIVDGTAMAHDDVLILKKAARSAGENIGAYGYGFLGIGNFEFEITSSHSADVNNYQFNFRSYGSPELTIAKKTIEITADAKTKVYGEADPTLTYQVTSGSLVGSDAFTGSLSRATGQAQGNYGITQGTLALSNNYDVTFVGANFYIDYRFIRIVPTVAVQKTYGDADPAKLNFPFTITEGSLAFDDTIEVFGTFRDAGENVGSYQIRGLSSTFTSTNGGQSSYAITYTNAGSVRLLINQRAIEVTADAKLKEYGNSDPALTYQITNGALQFSDAFTGSLERVSGEALGSYAINKGALTAGSNYAITFVGNNLTIGKRTVEVTADTKSKEYGDVDPVFTYQITNGSLAGSDAFTGNLERILGEARGIYAINQGTLGLNGNYNITYVSKGLTIEKRSVEVTADAKTKIYGEVDPSLTYQITNGSLVSGDTFTGLLTRVAGDNIGTYAINQGSLSLNSNYTLTYVSDDLSITTRALTVTASMGQVKVYGSIDPVFTYVLTSGTLVSGDAFTGALARTPGANAGNYAINQGTLTAGSNYTITFNAFDFTILPKPLLVNGNAGQSKIYGNTDPVLTYTLASGSLELGDNFTGVLTRTTGENIGNYTISQGTLTAGGNYIITFTSNDFEISQRAITITADAKNKVYGAADPALTYQISSGSLVNSDAFTGVLTRVTGENVGTYAINQGSLALNSNYTLTYVLDDLSITARAIEVTADAKNKVYGDVDPSLTYQITNGSIVSGDVFTGSLTRVLGETVGDYAITQGSLALNSNYTLTYVVGIFSITSGVNQVIWDGSTNSVWTEGTNWSNNTTPLISNNVLIPNVATTPNVVSGVQTNDLTVESLSSFDISENGSVTVDGNFTNAGTFKMISTAVNSSSLLVKGTANGMVSYERGGLIANKWSIVSAPVSGQRIKDFVENPTNNIRINSTVTPNRYAVGYYDDSRSTGNKWVYYTVDDLASNTITFEKGRSYAISRATNGSVTFTGSVETTDATKAVTASEWNAIGNPYTAFLPINENGGTNFINDNLASFDPAYVGTYVWDNAQNKYVAKSLVSGASSLVPGQGFFVKTTTGAGAISFKQAQRMTQPVSGGAFSKGGNIPTIELSIASKGTRVNTTVSYRENVTKGLDSGYDVGNFDGSQLDIYTRLLDGSSEKNFTYQSLPVEGKESYIIPVGIKAKEGTLVTISAKGIGLEGMDIYLEDKELEKFINLNEEDYSLTIAKVTNGVGRFYLHTKAQVEIPEVSLADIKLYNVNNKLFVEGVQGEQFKLIMYNISGALVYKDTFKGTGKNNIDLPAVEVGVYIVRVVTNVGTKSKKIILKK
ncbi:MBG domain-containing protein [uncultured Tenacibaculum sp.]|uniref:MBG domain-containing protein n=1 Tax=uncultured Tenacibaculum sp. TaxID=174713 RepID=UPI002628C658|nr:MBG domain-containing protein [uncultured Tenacibaculum sp.]